MMPASEAYELAKATRAELEPRKVKELLGLIEIEMLKQIEKGWLNLCDVTVRMEGIDEVIIDLSIHEMEKKGYSIGRIGFRTFQRSEYQFAICWNPTPKTEIKVGPYTLVKNPESDTVWTALLHWLARKLGF